MKTINFVLLYILLLHSTIVLSAGISGIVKDGYNSRLLSGANITLWEADGIITGAASDLKGEFVFENLPEGSYKIEVRMIGYCVTTKEVKINDPDYNDTIEISLDYGTQVECSKPVAQTPKTDQIKFNIVNQKSIDETMYVRIRVENKLSKSIFVPKNLDCNEVYKPVVRDKQNKDVKPNFVDMGCDVITSGHWKYYYDESDIIEVKPNSSKILYWIKVKLYSSERLKNKWVKVIYTFDCFKPLDNCLYSVPNIPNEEMKEIENIHCKLLNGTFETNYIFVN